MKRYRPHLIVLALYALLTAALTYPWILHFGSTFPGSNTWAFDDSTFVWNIWRFKHNLLDLQMSPLFTPDIFFPLGIDLVLYTYNFLNALLGLPILLGLNLTLASNFSIAFAYIFSGYGTYLLLRYLLPADARDARHTTIGHAAAFIGGAVYAFMASRAIFAALGHYDIVSTEFIPFFALFFIKTLREPGWKNPVLAGIFAALSLLAEMIFGVFLLFLGIVILLFEFKLLHRVRRDGAEIHREKLEKPLWTRWNLRESLWQVVRLLVLALTAAMIWLPAMLPILKAFTQTDFALAGWGESLKLSADLVGWFTPTALHPLWGFNWVTQLRQVQAGTAPFGDVNTVFLGWGILAIALIGAICTWKQAKAWAIGAITFAIFTLGPLLQIKGRYLFPLDNLLREQGIAQDITFPLPFALLHYLPIIKANRVPARFSVVLGLSLAVLVGFGAFKILKTLNLKFKVQRPKLIIGSAGLLLAIVLFDQISVPLPLTSAKVPNVYAQIGAEKGDFTLMQLPLGWRNSFGVYGAERTQIQYYQSTHGKPMIGGNISRAPDFKFDYYRNIPLFQAIAQTELPQSDPAVNADVLERAKAQAADLMTLYNVRYVLIHDPIAGRKPYEDTFDATRALAFALLPLDAEPTFLSDGVAAYRVNQPPIPNPLQLDFGDWTADPYRGAGWAGAENFDGASVNWATAPTAEIFIPYRGTGDRTLKMHLTPFLYPDAPPQMMTLRVNGQSAGDFPLNPDWQVFESTLPVNLFVNGLNRIELKFAHTAIPREVLPAQTAIGETGVSVPRDVEINSSVDFSFVTLGFGDDAVDASEHRRGINITVINPNTGAIMAQKGFDTAANQYENTALRDFLATIPDGQIVLVSSKGADAGAFLSNGFETLGGSAGVPAMPYSLIGVKGAAVGTAAESADGYLRLGRSPDTRSLAAAVDWVEISR